MLEHYGLEFRPDLVIVGVAANDVEDTRNGVAGLRVSRGYLVTGRLGDWADLGRWLYLRSHVARILIARAAASEAREVNRNLRRENEEGARERMEDAFDRMVRSSAAVDAEIVFLHIPQNDAWRTVGTEEALVPPARLRRFPLPRPAAGLRRPRLTLPARLRRFCRGRGDCHVVDVLPAMRAHPQPESLYYPKDGHCTEAGHALIAEVLGRELEELDLLPFDGAASGLPSAAR